ncbi:MAG: AAA family ATPase [Elusimicrobiota bacterium]
MAKSIAVAGKGGAGKTSLSAFFVRLLLEEKKAPILAVDADPNSNFSDALGLTYTHSIADLREEVRDEKKLPPGLSKLEYVDMRIQEIISEGQGVDLLVMGKPEGRGCYCYVNDILRQHLAKLQKNYSWVIMDNEAGMEHLSRRTTDDVDYLFLITDTSAVGLRAAGRCLETTKSINLKIKKISLIVNQVRSPLSDAFLREIKTLGLDLAGTIPHDEEILKFSEEGRPLSTLPPDNPAVVALRNIAKITGIM